MSTPNQRQPLDDSTIPQSGYEQYPTVGQSLSMPGNISIVPENPANPIVGQQPVIPLAAGGNKIVPFANMVKDDIKPNYPPADLTSTTGIPGGSDYNSNDSNVPDSSGSFGTSQNGNVYQSPIPRIMSNPQFQQQGTDMMNTNPNVVSSISNSYNTATDAIGYLKEKTDKQCVICYEQSKSIVEKILSPVISVIKQAEDCKCSCSKSLSDNLTAATAAAIENSSATVNNLPFTSPGEVTYTGPQIIAPDATLTQQTSQSIGNVSPAVQQQQPNVPQQSYPVGNVPTGYPQNQPVIPPVSQQPYKPTVPKTGVKIIRYNLWCDKDSGDYQVRDADLPPPIGNYSLVTTDTDPDKLAKLGQDSCLKLPYESKPKKLGPNVSYIGIEQITCDINNFREPSRLAEFFNNTSIDVLITSSFKLILDLQKAAYDDLKGLDVPQTLLAVAKQAADSPLVISQTIAPILANFLGCNDATFLNALTMTSLIGYFEETYGFQLGMHKLPFEYATNIRCRSKHLEPQQAMAAYLANQFDEPQLDTYWAIAGYCEQDLYYAIQAEKAKLVPEQLVEAVYRDLITPEEYTAGMRQLGYIDQTPIDVTYELFKEIPPVSELVRYMVRDADDIDIVNSLGLDDLFEHKYGKQLQEWAKNQGVTDEQMRYTWRSHWTIPGPQQLFEFWQRLRRDKSFGTPEEQRSKIEKALIHNDILPTWFNSYFAVQYNPMGRIDLRRAYNVGTISDKQLNDGYAAIGYNDETCDRLVEFTHKQKLQAAGHLPDVRLWLKFAISAIGLEDSLKKMGYKDDDISSIKDDNSFQFEHSIYVRMFMTGLMPFKDLESRLIEQDASKYFIQYVKTELSQSIKSTSIVDDYKAGFSTRLDTISAMTEYGIPADRAEQILKAIDDKESIAQTTLCANAVRKQYITGGMTKDQARANLASTGVVGEKIEKIMSQWDCLLKTGGKQASVSMLCNWLSKGAITNVDFMQRMQAIGYDTFDAANILSDCLDKINLRLTKEEKARLADETKRQNDEAKRIAKATEALRKQQNAIGQLNEQKARAKLNREKQMWQIAATLQGKCSCDLMLAMQGVKDAKQMLENDFGYSLDESIALMLKAAGGWKPPKSLDIQAGDIHGQSIVGPYANSSIGDWLALVKASATLVAQASLADSTLTLVSGETTNGSTQPS